MEGIPPSDTPSQDNDDNNNDNKKTRGNNTFAGTVVHSSELDSLPSDVLKGKKVLVIGGGASAVEAVETAIDRGADTEVSDPKSCYDSASTYRRIQVIIRTDKWIIPRNIVFDTAIAARKTKCCYYMTHSLSSM